MKDSNSEAICRILSLDGGGAKGFYSIGVLREVEAILPDPIHKSFDMIFGTSTGAIIASLLGLGHTVDDIYALYREYVPIVMRAKTKRKRSAALRYLSQEVYGQSMFSDMLLPVGIVATKWIIERPLIFKSTKHQAHGRKETFTPGFGVKVADAVQASCSAYPFFERKSVVTNLGDTIELVDGGFCANNPTLYAIADGVRSLGYARSDLRVLSVGVGQYPEPKISFLARLQRATPGVKLLNKVLEFNTQSLDQLRTVLFKDVPTVRVSDTFERPEMATHFLEHDIDKLSLLHQRGRDSFGKLETSIKQLLTQ